MNAMGYLACRHMSTVDKFVYINSTIGDVFEQRYGFSDQWLHH